MAFGFDGDIADHAIFVEEGCSRKLDGPYYKSAINPILRLKSYRGKKIKVFRLIPVDLHDVPDVVTTYHKEIVE